MVGEVNGKYEPIATIKTQPRAKNIGADQTVHKLYLPVVDLGPAAAPKDGKAAAPAPVPESFAILVVGR